MITRWRVWKQVSWPGTSRRLGMESGLIVVQGWLNLPVLSRLFHPTGRAWSFPVTLFSSSRVALRSFIVARSLRSSPGWPTDSGWLNYFLFPHLVTYLKNAPTYTHLHIHTHIYICIHTHMYIHLASQLGLWNTPTASLHWGKTPSTSVLVWLNNMMVRFQRCWSFEECEVVLYCHCSQVHSDPEW